MSSLLDPPIRPSDALPFTAGPLASDGPRACPTADPAAVDASAPPTFTTSKHTFPLPDRTSLTISLKQVEKKTYYGEDIKLTGHSIWFGVSPTQPHITLTPNP